jgi:hypothetical protein
MASPDAERSPTDSFAFFFEKIQKPASVLLFFFEKKKRRKQQRGKNRTNPIASAGCLVPAIVGARTLYQ